MVAIVFKGIGILRGDRFRLQFFFDGEKGAKMTMKTSASFTKNAPVTAKNLALFGNSSQNNVTETTINEMKNNNNEHRNDSHDSILPKINDSARGMNNTFTSTMNQSSRSSMGKSKSVPKLMKGLSIFGHHWNSSHGNKLLLSDKDLEKQNLKLMRESNSKKTYRSVWTRRI